MIATYADDALITDSLLLFGLIDRIGQWFESKPNIFDEFTFARLDLRRPKNIIAAT